MADRKQCVSLITGGPTNGVQDNDTRHTDSTMMLDHGVPIHTVSRRLGHSKVSTTLDVYAAFMPSADRVAADVIGQVLRDAKRNAETGKIRRNQMNNRIRKTLFHKHFGTRATQSIEATLGIEPRGDPSIAFMGNDFTLSRAPKGHRR